jgi:hypothetical protein
LASPDKELAARVVAMRMRGSRPLAGTETWNLAGVRRASFDRSAPALADRKGPARKLALNLYHILAAFECSLL